jgi:hypothetical protein
MDQSSDELTRSNTEVASWQREHFIPLRKAELIRLLAEALAGLDRAWDGYFCTDDRSAQERRESRSSSCETPHRTGPEKIRPAGTDLGS